MIIRKISELIYTPDETAIKGLLMECMEEHWGSLKGVVNTADQFMDAISKIQEIVGKF